MSSESLQKEELSYVLKDRKELLDELEVMQKNQALLAQGKSSQITLTKKSVVSAKRLMSTLCITIVGSNRINGVFWSLMLAGGVLQNAAGYI